MADDARLLAAEAMARVPRRSAWQRFVTASSAPSRQSVFDERPYGRCPRCGRLLPTSWRPMVATPLLFGLPTKGAMVVTPNRYELISNCLVDGRLNVRANTFELDDLVAAAQIVATELHRRGWRSWASIVTRALERPTEPERTEALMRAFWALQNAPGGNAVAMQRLAAGCGPHLPTRAPASLNPPWE